MPNRSRILLSSGPLRRPHDRASNVPFGQPLGWIAAGLANNTGGQLTQFTLAYDGEQWRDAGDDEPPYAQTMQSQYPKQISVESLSLLAKERATNREISIELEGDLFGARVSPHNQLYIWASA